MDPRQFNKIFGGEFNKIEGLVYDVFQEDTHVIPVGSLHPKTIYLAGVDWGYTNPWSLIVIGLEPDGTCNVVAEHYKAHQGVSLMVETAERYKKIYGIERFYCDPSSPANIAEFNKARLSAVPAVNDIRPGVDSVYEQISRGKLKFFEGRAPNLVDEISIYHYPADKDYDADKDIKEVLPVKQYDHACDALRYCIHSIKHKLADPKPLGDPARGVDRSLHITDHLIKSGIEDDNYDW